MALSKEDSHFLVFFPTDKTVQLLPNQRISFKSVSHSSADDDELDVSVMYETINIDDSGREVIAEIPYNGKVLFSGGSAKCKSFMTKVKTEVDFSKEEDTIVAMIKSQAQEFKKFGKRGASMKFKKALETELEEEATSSKKKKTTDKEESEKKKVPVTKGKKKTINSEKKTAGAISKEIKMKEMMAFAGVLSDENLPPQGSPPKIQTEGPPQKKDSDKTKPSTSSPRKKTSETKTNNYNLASKGSPTKTPQKMQPTRSSPRKKVEEPSKSSKGSPTKTPQKMQPTRSSPRKKVEEPNSSTPKSRILSPLDNSTDMTDLSTIRSAVFGGLNTVNSDDQYDEQSNFFYEDMDHHCSQEVNYSQDDQEPMAHSSSQFQEYGYNTSMQSSQNKVDSLQNIVGYFQRLEHNEKTKILSFLHVLVGGLHSFTYGVPLSESSALQQMPNENSLESSVASETTAKMERKLPLIADKNDTYNDVLVNPARLRTAEMTALTSKKPAHYLLNKVLDMVFTKDELVEAKGVKSLNQHKLDAIKEFMIARSKSLDIETLNSKHYSSIIQNKIGNLRFNSKKTVCLTTKTTL